ncbi:MAG: TIGR00159 family protein [Clostridiales bacterium]|nr:TIGR00159 family protein [Clostridiales bacterium]
MEGFLNNLASDIGVTDIIDILIVAFVAYKILGFIRESRAEQLVKGLLVLVAAFFLSDWFQLHTLNWILKGTMTVGIIALIVVFQPELRRGLEYMGRSKIIKPVFGKVDKVKAKMIVTEFAEALETMSTDKTGALIVIERETALEDICETGTIINADISAELIVNLFYEGSPLHDGAVIVRGDKLYSAGCVLPLTQNKNLSKDLGTRHRAGIGITENSDALVLVVSEETGIISIAEDGKLDRFLDIKTVEKILLNVYINKGNDKQVSGLKSAIDRLGRKKDVSE